MGESHYRVSPSGEVYPTALPPNFFAGDGVFTTFRTKTGEPFRMQAAHYQRLEVGAIFLGRRCPWASLKDFAAFWAGLALPEVTGEQVFRLMLTPSEEADALSIWLSLREAPPESQGVSLAVRHADRAHPHIKHFNLIKDKILLEEVRQQGFNDYIRVNSQGLIAEASYANVFWWDDRVLYTPDPGASGCLSGTERRAVIEAAQAAGIPVETGAYALESLESATACFLTNAVRGLYPVRSIDKIQWNLEPASILIAELRRYLPLQSTILPMS